MGDKQQALMTPELVAAQWSLAYRENEKFRADFDKDPKAAIAKLIGQDLPADVEVVVHHSKAGQVHVVVPDEIPDMTEEQLDSISGGIACDDARRAEWDRIRAENERDRVQRPI